MELNKIYQGDCRVLLKQVPNESIDLVCSDVAYRVQARGGNGNMGGTGLIVRQEKVRYLIAMILTYKNTLKICIVS